MYLYQNTYIVFVDFKKACSFKFVQLIKKLHENIYARLILDGSIFEYNGTIAGLSDRLARISIILKILI